MIYFSYNDFLDCMDNGKIDELTRIEEKVSKYKLKNGKNENTENNIINILKEKCELKKFLNEFLKMDLSQLGYNLDIIYYNHVKRLSNNKINDILIAKIKEKEIFIFIKLINQIDFNISYKMFEDTFNIIKKWNEEEKIVNKRNPIVIPTVIYTGKEKWNNLSYTYSKDIRYTTCKENSIKFFYNAIELNDLKVEDLRKIESTLAKEFMKLKYKYLQIN